jgi:transcriptional regulator with XRE-family HTH domain
METDNLRQNLKALSAEYGSVQRLSEALGVHRVQLSRMLHGRAQFRVDQAEKAAEFYGYTLRELLLPANQFEKVRKIVA